MDIAWKAEAFPVAGGGVIYIATAPLVQHLAAADLLAGRHITQVEGSACITDQFGRRTCLSFFAIRKPLFECFEVKPLRVNRGFRSVLLTCGFDADRSAAYLRRVSEIVNSSKHSAEGEGGFVGAVDLTPDAERAFFGQIPSEPMPVGDLLAAVARAAERIVDSR